MSTPAKNPWLHRYAFFATICTLLLIGVGGIVTSHEAGMSVPDWPTSYGYNMFALPFKFWKGGAFDEHTHRLVASTVGFVTAILAIWLWAAETSGKTRRNGIISIVAILLVVGGMMGVRHNAVFFTIAAGCFAGIIFGLIKVKQTAGLRWFGIVALCAVILQGVLGGLRVVLYKDQIGIFHATLAQLFLAWLSSITLFTSGWWKNLQGSKPVLLSRKLSWFAMTMTCLILVQLILGATMRHQHAGLAVPDFPLAYGKIWPPTDAASIQLINQHRLDVIDPNPITAFHIVVHMFHRITALIIFLGIGALAFQFRKTRLSRWAFVWFGMICVQVCLGIFTVLKNKPADIATAHVVFGAASLAIGALISLSARKISVERENGIGQVATASSAQPSRDFKTGLITN
jgi:cytochrome c oxidase assembly protein subunit 15